MEKELLYKYNEILNIINDIEAIVKDNSNFGDFINKFKKGMILLKNRLETDDNYMLEANRIRGARRWLGEYTDLPHYRKLYDKLYEIEEMLEGKFKQQDKTSQVDC